VGAHDRQEREANNTGWAACGEMAATPNAEWGGRTAVWRREAWRWASKLVDIFEKERCGRCKEAEAGLVGRTRPERRLPTRRTLTRLRITYNLRPCLGTCSEEKAFVA
jgi:hypothetical protein